MKKFFEKHDLFKLAGIFMLITILLSWIFKTAYFNNGVLESGEMTRVGLFDFTTYNLLGFYYFTLNLILVIVIAGFYKFLGSLEVYNRLTDKIAAIFNGKEKVFVAISILLFAVLAGLISDYFVLIALVPFMISILSKLKVDKVTGVASTFGGILVGILGATYSSKVVGIMADESYGIGVSYGYELVGVIILFAIAYLLLTYFTFGRMNKVKNDKKAELLVDPFETVVETKKTKSKVRVPSVLPLAIVLIVLLLNLVLGYIGWDSTFKIKIFSDALTWVKEATLFGSEVFGHILGGSLTAFGEWDLLTFAGLLLIATLVIKIIYHIPFDKILDEYGKGFQIISKTVVIMLIIYSVLLFSVINPTITVIVNAILSLGNNVFTLFFSGIVTTLFTVDMQYTVSLIGSLFQSLSNVNVGAFALQAANGLVGFVAPTSLILMIGLSMMDVKYTDWFKYIWKFILALLVVILIVIAILMYV